MGIYEYSDIFMNTNNHECLGSDPSYRYRETQFRAIYGVRVSDNLRNVG
jgi:hypothetical protein